MTTLKIHSAALLVGFVVAPLGAAPTRAAELRLPDGETASLAAPDRGLKAGDWLVRGGIVGMIPVHQKSSIDRIGGRIDTPSALLPDGGITYFLTDHVAIEGQAGALCTRPKIRDTLVGDFAIGSVCNAAALGIVQYHFLPDARFNPYLGIGVSTTWPIVIDPARGIPDFKLVSQTSMVLQAGVDVNLGGNWFANVAVKYMLVPPSSYELAGTKVQADLDMLIVGAGIGYRF